jgi:mannan endo-1,4-beta-mannosidase
MATLGGVELAATPASFSGTGFVTGFDATDNLSITIDNPTAGLYKLGIGYTSPFGEKGYDLKVNTATSSGMFVSTATGAMFRSVEAGTFLLPKGLNTINTGCG